MKDTNKCIEEKLETIRLLLEEYNSIRGRDIRLSLCTEIKKGSGLDNATQSEAAIVNVIVNQGYVIKNRHGKSGRILTDEDIKEIEKNAIYCYKIKQEEVNKSKNASVEEVFESWIKFSDGSILESEHEQDCCKKHYLDFSQLTMRDFEGMKFDLSTDGFFERIEGYGIALKPLNNHPVRIAGYGYNNGYYNSDMDLVLRNGKERRVFDISECQKW